MGVASGRGLQKGACSVGVVSSLCCRVNLALAYTELTEELGRVRELAIKQSAVLRQGSQEPGPSLPSRFSQHTEQNQRPDLVLKHTPLPRVSGLLSDSVFPLYAPVPRPHPAPQRLSPTSSQRASLSPDRLLPAASPPLSPNAGPASYSHQPSSSRLRAKFQGRRSYSEVGSFSEGGGV